MTKWLDMVNTRFYNCHDQDIFNITCKGYIKEVSNLYNSSLSTGFHNCPKIMHYAGQKPWNSKNISYYKIWEELENECRLLRLSRIPKIIHYCWFGGKPKPEIVLNCIQSWKDKMPDYKIVEWNETNFDVNAHGDYVKKAAAEQKWAFVTDYIRLYAIYKYGGIYMDSDVQVYKPLDRFLSHRAFTGHETNNLLITATMGAEAEHPWIGMLLSYYKNAKLDHTPNTITITRLSKQYIAKQDNNFTYLHEGVVIYPIKTFCSYDHKNLKPLPTYDSYAMHLFAGTWIGRTKI
jgi:lipopolysaccharide biosynthesis glycosyltransferase